MTETNFDHLNRPQVIGDRVIGAANAPDGIKGCKGTVIGRTKCSIMPGRWYWRVKWNQHETPIDVWPDFLVRQVLN